MKRNHIYYHKPSLCVGLVHRDDKKLEPRFQRDGDEGERVGESRKERWSGSERNRARDRAGKERG